MVTFDDAETKNLIKRKRTYDGLNWLLIAVLFFSALIAAILAKSAYENYLGVEWDFYLAAFITAVVFLLALVFYQIFVVGKVRRQLNYAVAKRIAEGFYANENMLKGGGKIELDVLYEDNKITVTRKNVSREISLSAVDLLSGKISAGNSNSITFDLTELKSLPALFGAFGTKIWAFVQAYYAVNTGFDSIYVTDNTGKKPLTMVMGQDGKLCNSADKNYYIKRGIVK